MSHSSPASTWVTAVSVGLLLTNALAVSLAVLGSDWSYRLWATAGMTSFFLLIASPIAALLLIAFEKWRDRRRVVTWPALLLLATGIPLLGLFTAGMLLDL